MLRPIVDFGRTTNSKKDGWFSKKELSLREELTWTLELRNLKFGVAGLVRWLRDVVALSGDGLIYQGRRAELTNKPGLNWSEYVHDRGCVPGGRRSSKPLATAAPCWKPLSISRRTRAVVTLSAKTINIVLQAPRNRRTRKACERVARRRGDRLRSREPGGVTPSDVQLFSLRSKIGRQLGSRVGG